MAESKSSYASSLSYLKELFPHLDSELIQDVLHGTNIDFEASLNSLLDFSCSDMASFEEASSPSLYLDNTMEVDFEERFTPAEPSRISIAAESEEEISSEDGDNYNQAENPQADSKRLIPRSYQLELFDHAKTKNSILVLGTGSGKTFISIMLIKEFGHELQGTVIQGAKKTVFIVNTVPLVYQQALAIKDNTPYEIGKFEGSMDVDNWSDERWAQELDKYQVLVMVAQIFQDLLLVNRLKLSSINLIIMDECHHATGDHPMRQAMRHYSEEMLEGLSVPRIVGLTACIIHRKCGEHEVEKLVRDVEVAMNASVVTATDQNEVTKHATKPKIMFISFKQETPSQDLQCKKRCIESINTSMNEYISNSLLSKRDQNSLSKSIKKILLSLSTVLEDLGLYCFKDALKYDVDYYKKIETDFPLENDLYHLFSKELYNLYENFKCNQLTFDPLVDISNKIRRLLELLKQGHEEKFFIIIFVQRRNVAQILSEFLNEVASKDHELSYIKSGCILGGGNAVKEDIRVRRQLRKQKQTLDDFRDGILNVIVSTSVLEEGVDIRRCNMVIRFDPPMNFRSFIQSLGRARAEKACYIIIENEIRTQELRRDVHLYLNIQNKLTKICHDRALPTYDEIFEHFDDQLIPSFAPFGPSGPKITSVSSLQLVNKYCGKLPQDKFTRLYVNVKRQTVGENIVIGLQLPINAPLVLHKIFWGDPMPNHFLAKQSASLKLCKTLFDMKELNENLLPRKPNSKKIELDYFSMPQEDVPKGANKPGTRKRRQVYPRYICNEFSFDSPEMHLHMIHFDPSPVQNLKHKSIETSLDVGLIFFGKVETASFPLFSHKWGTVNVQLEYLGPSKFPAIELISNFHRLVMQTILKLDLDIFEFSLETSSECLFIVPLNKMKKIDVAFLKGFEGMQTLFSAQKCCDPSLLSELSDIAVFPNYRKSELFYIEAIENHLTPRSPFPDSKKKYSSYEEFFKITHGCQITDLSQPLLSCKCFPKEMNHLTITPITKKTSNYQNPRLIPELCNIFPIPASLWWKLLCVPSILHRLKGLLIEKDLLKNLNHDLTPSVNNMINYNWAEDIVNNFMQEQTDNLCVLLHYKINFDFHPGMVVQALTPTSAGDNFNLERLEVLGDSFLKHEVGKFLFYKQSTDHEGFLSVFRSSMVSNKTLYSFAKKKNLSSLYQTSHLMTPSFAHLPFCFAIKKDIDRKLREMQLPVRCWTSTKIHDDITEEDKSPTNEVHNPWTEQLIPDKCLADSVEALIGVMLLAGGEKTAMLFMTWLGFEFLQEEIVMPDTAVITKEGFAFEKMYKLYHQSVLSKVEEKIGYVFKDKSFLVQAFTHPSSNRNRVTECYQRLEFLGDSVLDYLVTGFIYANHLSYNPGEMTDLRSHYVKNETLAKVALRHNLHVHMDHFSPLLDKTIRDFKNMLQTIEGEEQDISKWEKDLNWESDVMDPEDVDVPKALGDIVESLIGAVFIDSGCNLKTTWDVVELLLREEFNETLTYIPINPIRRLYEVCPFVTFTSIPPEEDNPAEVHVHIKGHPDIKGRGKNKRTAKISAAKKALNYLSRLKQTNSNIPSQ